MAEQDTDAASVRGIAEDKGVYGVSIFLIAEPSQDAEGVWGSVHVIAEDEKGRGLFANKRKGLGGGSSGFDLKAGFCELIAQVLASVEVPADDVSVNKAQREGRGWRCGVSWLHTRAGVNRFKL